MEDRPGQCPATGLGHELRSLPRPQEHPDLQRLSENGARPVTTLGRLKALPGFRLGALVFQPHKTEPLYWASLWAPTRIAGCALGDRPTDTRWENVSSERRSASGLTLTDPTRPKVLSMPGELLDRPTISFSLWTVRAEHTPKTPGSSLSSCRERMHPQSTDGLSAQVALLQSLILSAVAIPCRLDHNLARQIRTMT